MPKYRVVSILALFSLTASCASYHPLPLSRESIQAALAPPNLKQLQLEAEKIRHPLLKPLRINLNDGLSPEEAAVLAVLANPTLKSVRDEKKIAHAELLQAGLLPNPRFGAGYAFPTGGDTAGTVNAYGLQFGWDFTSLIGRGARLSAARSHQASVDLMVAWKEWQVAESAKLQVFHILWADRRLSLLLREKKALSRDLELIGKAASLGEQTAVELAAAESSARQVQLEIDTTQQDREQARLLLNRDLGFPPDVRIPIQKEPALSAWPKVATSADFFAGIDNRRPDLLALKMGYESQEAKLRATILSQFPDIGIQLNHAGDADNIITTGLSVTISFPIFDHAQGRIAIERATRGKLHDAYMARIFDTRANLAAIMEKIASARKRIATARQSVAAQKRLVKTYRTALDQGNADILSYYQARNELLAKRLALLGLRASLTDLGVALETTAGVYFPLYRAEHMATTGKGKK